MITDRTPPRLPIPAAGRSRASDEDLAERTGRGDERAFEELVARHGEPLRRYCRTITGNADDAEEALQTILMNAHRALLRDAAPAAVRPWLYRIAHNACLNVVRDRPRWTSLEPEVADAGPEPFASSATRERMRRLRADLEALDPAPRTALLLRELAGMSHQEIAAAVGGADAAVAKRLIREAREALNDLALGRDTPCPDIRRTISDGDGRVLRSRRMRSHLRDCAECASFRAAIGTRAHDLAALAAVPAAAGTLRALTGAAAGTTAGASALTAGGGTTGGLVAALAGAGIGAKVAVVAGIAVVGVAGATMSPAAQPDTRPTTATATLAAGARPVPPDAVPPGSAGPGPRAEPPAAAPAIAVGPAGGGDGIATAVPVPVDPAGVVAPADGPPPPADAATEGAGSPEPAPAAVVRERGGARRGGGEGLAPVAGVPGPPDHAARPAGAGPPPDAGRPDAPGPPAHAGPPEDVGPPPNQAPPVPATAPADSPAAVAPPVGTPARVGGGEAGAGRPDPPGQPDAPGRPS